MLLKVICSYSARDLRYVVKSEGRICTYTHIHSLIYMVMWGIFGRQPHRRGGWKDRVCYEREGERGSISR